jgi:glycosyltransferase involved in cell wall biosynthesis
MMISVAMCTFQGERFIKDQLESLLAQTRTPDELIICDDRSSDGTVEIIEEFTAKATFSVKWQVNPMRLGSTKNFEKAIGLCEGDIIALSDQDDVWLPDKLERHESEYLSDSAVGMVVSDARLVDDNLLPLGYHAWELLKFSNERRAEFRNGGALKYLINRLLISGCMMSFRSRFKDLLLPIPVGIHNVIHDRWIAILLSAVSKIVLLEGPLVLYRQHSSQQTGFTDQILIRKSRDQLGSKGASVKERVLKKYEYDSELLILEPVYERLIQFAERFPCESALDELSGRIGHWNTRSQLAEEGLRKVYLVLRELFSGRYHRYSNGVLSAAKDLAMNHLGHRSSL